MPYSTRYMRVKNIGIHPQYLNADIQDEITRRTYELISNKQTRNGLVMSATDVVVDGCGEIRFDNTGYTYYSVIATVKLYTPVLHEMTTTTVLSVSAHGFYADLPVETFIATSGVPTESIGDAITIRTMKVGFNRNKFVVIAKLV